MLNSLITVFVVLAGWEVIEEKQAQARCVKPEHNRGTEAAMTAIEMARLMQEI